MSATEHRLGGRVPWCRMFLALGLAALAGSCALPKARIVLETRDGIEISLRPERHAPRPAPGAEFQDLRDFKIERSLKRVVVRYGKVISFYRSDPVPLFSDGQVNLLTDVLMRELPKLPADKRIGLAFYDQYRNDLVDVELYPEGDYLVFDFRALMVLKDDEMRRRGQNGPNYGELVQQRDQILDNGRYPLLKDPIASAARPEFTIPGEYDSKTKKEESPL